LDASALLTLLFREPGEDIVREILAGGLVSTVNWSETRQKLAQRGVEPATVDYLLALGVTVEPFSLADAEVASGLFAHTRSAGLSLGDRACLALAVRLGAVAVTTDKAWAAVDAGVPIRLVR
jgi:PIN domain nuclease of toxin-antitoxin system